MQEMMNDKKVFVYLQIEQGAPYAQGTCILLNKDTLIIGRSTHAFSVDISFDNFLISRNHCCVKYYNGVWHISDLGSKHGTNVNEQPIAVQEEHILKSGDKVVLASGIVVFRFMISLEIDKTLDFDRTQSIKIEDGLAFASHVAVDLEKMNLLVDKQVIALSVKEWLFLEILYRQRGKVVSYEDIKRAVWPERYTADTDFSPVGLDEVNMVSYRLRKRLGKYSKMIKTIRGRGCMFDL